MRVLDLCIQYTHTHTTATFAYAYIRIRNPLYTDVRIYGMQVQIKYKQWLHAIAQKKVDRTFRFLEPLKSPSVQKRFYFALSHVVANSIVPYTRSMIYAHMAHHIIAVNTQYILYRTAIDTSVAYLNNKLLNFE